MSSGTRRWRTCVPLVLEEVEPYVVTGTAATQRDTRLKPSRDVALALHRSLAPVAAEGLLVALGQGGAAPEAAHVTTLEATTDSGAA